MVQIDFTVQRFPATGPLKEACGIPLSCVVQPITGSTSKAPAAPAMLSALARCQHCYAYINHLCELSDSSFTCSVCGRSTGLKHLTQWHSTYCRYPAARQHLPELTQQVYEVLVDPQLPGAGATGQQQGAYPGSAAAAAAGMAGQPAAVPVTLLLVDTAGPGEFLELVRGGLSLGLEALPADSLVGLLGVADCITLVDMAGAGGPMLHHLPVLEAAPALVPLEDVLPLSSLLLPVAVAKQRIAQALDLLLPEPASSAAAANSSSSRGLQQPGMDRRGPAGPAAGSSNGAGGATSSSPAASSPHQQQQQQHQAGGGGKSPPCRAVGPALHAVLEYLRGLHAPHADPAFPGSSSSNGEATSPSDSSTAAAPAFSGVAQLVLFLSGPPDTAYGKTVAATAAGNRPPGAGAADATISPGSGDLTRQMAGMQLHYPLQDPKSRSFYEQAAVAAASMGVVVDVFAAARGYIGLQTLEPLVNSTGGALYLYPSAEEATLPQDLSRRLATPKALSGMLRLRTCPQLKVTRCYGRLYPDQQYADLFHVPCCDPGHSFVFDFDHVGSGVYDEKFQQVTLQVAFQYAQVVAVGSGPGSRGMPASTGSSSSSSKVLAAAGEAGRGSSSSLAALAADEGGRSFVVQRRLRVCTIRLPVALGPAEVYSSVDADTVLTVLTHKITKAVRTQSVSEARLLLRDWLVIFTANYHRNSFMRASAAQLLQLPVDLTFSSCPPLQPLPRLVYALLRSPLLSSAAQYHSDLTAYLHHLWCCLPPRELAKAVYPGLSAFADPDTLIASGLALSRNSLQGTQLAEAAAAAAREVVTAASAASQAAAGAAAAAAGAAAESAVEAAEHSKAAQAALAVAAAVAEGKQAANILLLDAFILVLVVYRAGAPGELPFPPPQQSKLSRIIADIKRERRVTTHVEVVREGGDGAELFYSLLIDDPDELADTPIPPLGQQQQQQGAGAAGTPGGAAGAAAAAGGGGGGDEGPPAGPSPTGVAQFIEHIKAEVFTQLQPQQ
ncbi:hypothetical protein OEZ85_011873 [Tetradesmus obliquus]|uniref:Uncharacterized protein n=1 Tax=Tetradesmus obliquus TaxID=3088 RepID=A0ABY8TSE2_TETOB|nr:hypothetical protein OEZ85_011873 [Tetradesmus obliquus]